MEQEQPNPFIKVIHQARTLFKTQFHPQSQNKNQKQILLKLKLNGEYKNLIQKIQNDHEKKTFAKDTIQQKKALDINQKMPQIAKQHHDNQHDLKQLKPVQKMIKQMIVPVKEDKNIIKSFDKYQKIILGQNSQQTQQKNRSLVLSKSNNLQMNLVQSTKLGTIRSSSLRKLIKPKWHPPFKLYRVIAGHQGWVRCIAVSPCNSFFATGSADRTIKFWDLASGQLKISLTGHINTVRGMQFSQVHPYLFSCGQDKSVKCWDLQMNKVIRNYHGHLSGVYCLKIHHGLSVLVTGGRDSAVRVWDIRVRKQIHCLSGHAHTVGSLVTQQHEPHVISGSFDSFVKLWDIGTGKCVKTLTNHKKSIRAMVQNPYQYTFATAASDSIKVWKCPDGQFLRNISGHDSIINAMAVNQDGVLVSGGDDGSMRFWDWSSGYNYQDLVSQPQPGSISAQGGIFALQFDRSGSRLISGQCDKTIKMWKQDDTANEQSHPIKSFKMQFEKK